MEAERSIPSDLPFSIRVHRATFTGREILNLQQAIYQTERIRVMPSRSGASLQLQLNNKESKCAAVRIKSS